ncbi:Hpt domain-containing protein [Oceanobacter mangrovi]|uniref:Hpt domain-containing protein n=1 Tax=Oceanobacter mangrovi TaxID=2862510 RepID=UPI001C8D8A99|nr:Hpt domain-containing protein [Oceanobacter mangrovi]
MNAPSVPVVVGIDAAAALERMNQRHDLFWRLLGSFQQQLATAPAQLQQLLQQADAEALRAWLHQLKGMAGNMCASELWQLVSTMEQQLKQHKPPSSAQLTALENLLASLLASTAAALEVHDQQPPTAAVVRPEEELHGLQLALQEAAELIRKDYGRALQQIEQLAPELQQAGMQTELQALLDCLYDFDIDSSCEAIANLLTRLGDNQ